MVNEGSGDTNVSSGISPQPDQGELVSTIELSQQVQAMAANTDPEGANNTGAQGKIKTDESAPPEGGKGTGGDEKGTGGADTNADDTRFDNHPRFQQLIAERDGLKTSFQELNDKFTQLEKSVSGNKPGDAGEGDESPMAKLAGMSKNDLADFISDNPHDYTQMILDQAKSELTSEFGEKLNQGRFEDAVVGELEAFAKAHEDFDPMYESGLLQQFISSHPGHNAISAYFTLTADKRQGEVQGLIDNAVKKAEDKFTANQKARNQISIMPSAPQGAPNANAIDPELSDTKKHGGKTTVLANRLARMRQAKAGNMV